MSTLIKPAPHDETRSQMENTLELTHLSDIDPNMFTNTRPLWHPPGARGVFGGAVIAQCLSAAQKTVPPDFSVHSMHCYFVLAGNSEIPITYHVERVRDGKSFITRTVQARQRARPIFTVTLSFQRVPKGDEKMVRHAVARPDIAQPSEDDIVSSSGPFETLHRPMQRDEESGPQHKRARMFVRVKGKISGGHEAHLTALAYMSDSFFIGTVARAHKLWRNFPPQGDKDQDRIDMIHGTKDPREKPGKLRLIDMGSENLKAREESSEREQDEDERPEIGMMVSLDHTIYFHNPRDFRADQWMLEEMETPWSGDHRGLVMQRIWSSEGKLVATCIQEGLIRLKQDSAGKPKL